MTPDSQFRKELDMYLETVAAGSKPRLAFLETHLGGASSESPEIQAREDRLRALMKYFYTALMECAEDVADEEIGPIEGTPKEPAYELRPDSLYYPYNLARKSGYADFSAEQRKVLKGLVLRTAFETMEKVAFKLQCMSGCEVEIVLRPKCAPDIEHPLHQPDIDEYPYWNPGLVAHLTKYEY